MSRIARTTDREFGNNPEYLRLKRKADQAWDLAGAARADGDTKEETRYTAEAREYESQLRMLIQG